MELKKFTFIAVFTASVVGVSGCQSTGIVPLDKGVYYISKTNARFGMGPPEPETISSVYKEARSFCQKSNDDVERINNIYSDSGYGKPANFALEFRCVKR